VLYRSEYVANLTCFGNASRPFRRYRIKLAIQILFRPGRIVVVRADSDDVREFNPHFLGRLDHLVGGLFLAIEFAAVGDRGAVEEIDRDIGAVVKMPKFLLIPRDGAQVRDVKKVGGFAESRARRGGGPEAGVMRRVQPARRPAHRKSAHEDPVLVDGVMRLHAVHRLKRIDFTGETVGVAIAAIRMQHDRVRRGELTGAFHVLGQEVDLIERLAAAVIPDVESMLLFLRRQRPTPDHQPVWLHGSIDF